MVFPSMSMRTWTVNLLQVVNEVWTCMISRVFHSHLQNASLALPPTRLGPPAAPQPPAPFTGSGRVERGSRRLGSGATGARARMHRQLPSSSSLGSRTACPRPRRASAAPLKVTPVACPLHTPSAPRLACPLGSDRRSLSPLLNVSLRVRVPQLALPVPLCHSCHGATVTPALERQGACTGKLECPRRRATCRASRIRSARLQSARALHDTSVRPNRNLSSASAVWTRKCLRGRRDGPRWVQSQRS
jgi:hypothetical protein